MSKGATLDLKAILEAQRVLDAAAVPPPCFGFDQATQRWYEFLPDGRLKELPEGWIIAD